MELFGRIVDSINRKAVEKAKVTLYVGNEELAVRYSDNEGKFEHKEAAHYIGEDLTYKVEKDGYEPLESSTRIEGTKVLLKDIELVANDIKVELSFKGESHDPLENVKVTLEVGGEKVGEGFTSKDGLLKFSLSPELEGKRLSYKGEIADFEVASGEFELEKKTSREITMTRPPVTVISGKVEDNAGKSLVGARVRLFLGDRELAKLHSDANGRFEHEEKDALQVGKDLTYRVEKEGYKTAEGSSKIQEKGLSLEVTLNPQAISPTPPKKEPRSIPSMPIIPIVAAVGLVLVIIGAIYIINSPKHPPAQPATDLTGEWQGDDGGTYYIIDLGTEIWWYGEQSAVNPGWSNVGVGKRPQGSINGNDLKLRWVDIPKGQTRGQGILVLAVEKSGNKLRAQQRTGGFGGSTWTRLPSPTVASRINREVPVIPEPPFEPSAYDLTGVWQGDDGGTYYIRHIGSEIWWYGERAPENPVWANDAFGNIGGNIVNLRWVDMPKGQTRGQGILALVVENSGNTLRAQQRTGGFGGSTWTRVD